MPATVTSAARQVQFSCDAPVTFCDMVTTEEYGREQTAATTQSLLSLLDVIIADTAMPRKDKRKKLKQVNFTGRIYFFVSEGCRAVLKVCVLF